ncbi:hypothetical protein ES707_12702 [subsurface metagenome]
MAKGKNVLTTGDVAKMCNVAPRTVSKWFDSGKLKGYRIPGSKDRRIPLSELIRFMKGHDIPSPIPSIGKTRVLIVDSDPVTASALAEELKSKADYEVDIVTSTFETGVVAQKLVPHILLLNLLAKEIDAPDICENIRANDELQSIRIIALANDLSEGEAHALLQKGFDGYVSDPSDMTEVVRRIEDAVAITY